MQPLPEVLFPHVASNQSQSQLLLLPHYFPGLRLSHLRPLVAVYLPFELLPGQEKVPLRDQADGVLDVDAKLIDQILEVEGFLWVPVVVDVYIGKEFKAAVCGFEFILHGFAIHYLVW